MVFCYCSLVVAYRIALVNEQRHQTIHHDIGGNDMKRRIEAVMAARVPKKIKGKEYPWSFIRSRTTEHSFDFAYSVPVGFSCEDLAKHQGALVASLGSDIEIIDRGGVVIIKVVRSEFTELLEYKTDMLPKDKLLLGYTRETKPIYTNPVNPHLLLSGASGYGKTDSLRFYMLQMIHQHPDIDISIIDLKGFSFLPFEKIGVKVVDDVSEARDVLKEAYLTMRERIKSIRESGNREACKNLPWKLVIIDEYAELSPNIVTDPEERKIVREATRYISSLIRIGREVKCAVWLCTQYPTKEVIHNQIKAQMINVVSLKLEEEIESQTVIGSKAAYELPPIPGRAVVKGSGIIQVPFVGGDRAWEKVLSEYKLEVNHDKTGEAEEEYTDSLVGYEDHRYTTG